MAIHVRNMTGTIHAVEGGDLLTPQALDLIVQAVLAAIDERKLRERRASSDTKVSAGATEDAEGRR